MEKQLHARRILLLQRERKTSYESSSRIDITGARSFDWVRPPRALYIYHIYISNI
jgi:hypothetical protein